MVTILHSAASGSGGASIYGARVYKSGSTYHATGPTGVLISSGSEPGAVINAAIASLPTSASPFYDRGTVFVDAGKYDLKTTVTIPRNVAVTLDYGCRLWTQWDIDMIHIEEHGGLEGGTIGLNITYDNEDDWNVIPYTCAVITINGNSPVWQGSGGFLRNIDIQNWTDAPNCYKGTAILLNSTGTDGHIWGYTVENVRIDGFYYGIHINRSGPWGSGGNWINGNKFLNVKMESTTRMVWMDANGADLSDINANIFDGLELQTGGRVLADGPAFYITGSYHWFRNTNIWDWNIAWGNAVTLDAYSTFNLFEHMRWENTAGYITDLGVGNNIVTQYGLVQQNRVLPEKGKRYHLARALTAEGVDLQIQSNAYNVDYGASTGDGYQNIFYVFKSGNESIVDLTHYKTNANGIFKLYVNGILDSETTYDHYASTAAIAYNSITLTVALKNGWNTLNFVANGKNASSSNYFFMARALRLR